jgi:hypothetical protein
MKYKKQFINCSANTRATAVVKFDSTGIGSLCLFN